MCYQEFYIPIKEAALINNQQLTSVFLNLEELVEVNENFIEKLNQLIENSSLDNEEVSYTFYKNPSVI